MKTLAAGQTVKYITSANVATEGTITEVIGPQIAHVRWADKNLALARYSDGKEANTFHFDEPEEAAPEPPKPFKPGAKASPDKPTKSARKASSPVT